MLSFSLKKTAIVKAVLSAILIALFFVPLVYIKDHDERVLCIDFLTLAFGGPAKALQSGYALALPSSIEAQIVFFGIVALVPISVFSCFTNSKGASLAEAIIEAISLSLIISFRYTNTSLASYVDKIELTFGYFALIIGLLAIFALSCFTGLEEKAKEETAIKNGIISFIVSFVAFFTMLIPYYSTNNGTKYVNGFQAIFGSSDPAFPSNPILMVAFVVVLLSIVLHAVSFFASGSKALQVILIVVDITLASFYLFLPLLVNRYIGSYKVEWLGLNLVTAQQIVICFVFDLGTLLEKRFYRIVAYIGKGFAFLPKTIYKAINNRKYRPRTSSSKPGETKRKPFAWFTFKDYAAKIISLLFSFAAIGMFFLPAMIQRGYGYRYMINYPPFGGAESSAGTWVLFVAFVLAIVAAISKIVFFKKLNEFNLISLGIHVVSLILILVAKNGMAYNTFEWSYSPYGNAYGVGLIALMIVFSSVCEGVSLYWAKNEIIY